MLRIISINSAWPLSRCWCCSRCSLPSGECRGIHCSRGCSRIIARCSCCGRTPGNTGARRSDYDPTLYDKLDKLQESVDALTAAVAPSDGSNGADDEVLSQDPAPDYTAQISGISNQLEILTQQATAETAEPSAFVKPFEEYSTIEAIGLLAFVAFSLAFFVAAIKIFIF